MIADNSSESSFQHFCRKASTRTLTLEFEIEYKQRPCTYKEVQELMTVSRAIRPVQGGTDYHVGFSDFVSLPVNLFSSDQQSPYSSEIRMIYTSELKSQGSTIILKTGTLSSIFK